MKHRKLEEQALPTPDRNVEAVMNCKLSLDGNQYCALIGENLQEGTAGFGVTLPAALRALAAELEAVARKELVTGGYAPRITARIKEVYGV